MSGSPAGTDEQETILVVDDNAANRLLAEAMLSSGGYGVRLAEGGTEALEAFESEPPSLVLLDVLMPGMDGFETLARIRTLPRGASAPIMIVTALADLASVQRAIEAGADDFVTKPINRNELLIRISTLLGRRKRAAPAVETTAVGLGCGEAPPQVADRRDEMASLLVHDLKHPLTTIYFNAGLLARDPTLSPRGAAKVQRILRSSETLETMMMSILDVTCSVNGSLPLHLTEFEVASLLADVKSAMAPQAEGNHQSIEVVAPRETGRIKADRDLLRRGLENLIDNSTKYGPPESTIRLEVRSVGVRVQFRVRDEGPGVPLVYREKIFERNFQLEAPAASVGRRGRGLGLTSVRVAAEAHGGRAWIEDHAAGGSCFCIEIPVDV